MKLPTTCPLCGTRSTVVHWPPEHIAALVANIKAKRFLCHNCADPKCLDCVTPRPRYRNALDMSPHAPKLWGMT